MRYTMLRKNKKSNFTMFEIIKILILTLIVMFILFLIMKNHIKDIVPVIENQKCRSANQQLADLIIDSEESGDFKVGVGPFVQDYLVLVSKEINENCPTVYTSYDGDDPEEAQELVADAFLNCYDKYLEGKQTIFPNEETYCAVCEVIDFRDADLGKINQNVDFWQYLHDHKTKLDPRKTYWEYLGFKDKSYDKNILSKTNINKFYPQTAVVFMSVNDKNNLFKNIGYTALFVSSKFLTISSPLYKGVDESLNLIGWSLTTISYNKIQGEFTNPDGIVTPVNNFFTRNTLSSFNSFAIADYDHLKDLGCTFVTSSNKREPLLQDFDKDINEVKDTLSGNN